jgi:cytochrome c peroxidase
LLKRKEFTMNWMRPWALALCLSSLGWSAAEAVGDPQLATSQDRQWLLPDLPPHPDDNAPTTARIELGKMLFFDARLSSERNLSCAGCHSPLYGWSDGLGTAKGFRSKVLGRASPTIVNSGYNTIQMWDGRRATLEHQAMGPMESMDEMAMNLDALFAWLAVNPSYRAAFAAAYPGEAIDKTTTSKAIAAFERTVISNDSPFDRWLRGDRHAMTARQVNGFRLFSDPNKGNCAGCHQAPNFTDNGFHNVGLASYGQENPDVGRFAIKPVSSLKGAFKTPTLRDVALTAPYFHDGSAATLLDVVAHYNRGGEVRTNLSTSVKPLSLSKDEMRDIVSFMEALTTPAKPFTLPQLPAN